MRPRNGTVPLGSGCGTLALGAMGLEECCRDIVINDF